MQCGVDHCQSGKTGSLVVQCDCQSGETGSLVVWCGVDHCQSGETGSQAVRCGVGHCQSGETGSQAVRCGVGHCQSGEDSERSPVAFTVELRHQDTPESGFVGFMVPTEQVCCLSLLFRESRIVDFPV